MSNVNVNLATIRGGNDKHNNTIRNEHVRAKDVSQKNGSFGLHCEEVKIATYVENMQK